MPGLFAKCHTLACLAVTICLFFLGLFRTLSWPARCLPTDCSPAAYAAKTNFYLTSLPRLGNSSGLRPLKLTDSSRKRPAGAAAVSPRTLVERFNPASLPSTAGSKSHEGSLVYTSLGTPFLFGPKAPRLRIKGPAAYKGISYTHIF
ncbi:hypothetical protein CGRA01v4_02150 [Colletotrichum graminicola]|nr:hypothetical protein CGRA01v4_02150 [Colletotrichum graminicola]